MLTQEVVLVFLEVSITGAGLVLAIYALIIPFSKKVFESNLLDFPEVLRLIRVKLNNFSQKRLDKQSADKGYSFAARLLEYWAFPTYLRFGVGATFFGYSLTTLVSLAWIIDWQKPIMDSTIVPAFALSTVIFLFVGLISIKDVHKIMRQDFNEMIKSLKENENKTQDQM